MSRRCLRRQHLIAVMVLALVATSSAASFCLRSDLLSQQHLRRKCLITAMVLVLVGTSCLAATFCVGDAGSGGISSQSWCWCLCPAAFCLSGATFGLSEGGVSVIFSGRVLSRCWCWLCHCSAAVSSLGGKFVSATCSVVAFRCGDVVGLEGDVVCGISLSRRRLFVLATSSVAASHCGYGIGTGGVVFCSSILSLL